MSSRVRRHPILGFFAGLFFGFGLALLLFVFGVVPMTTLWFAIVTGGGVVLGLVTAYRAPVRGQ